MQTISVGKYRGLSQVSTEKSAFSILALDHRNNLRRAINSSNPSHVSNEDLSLIKIEIVKAVSSQASAVLLDPEVGAFQCISTHSLPGKIGLICAIEETGYTGDPLSRMSKILNDWDVTKAKRMGASAIKLLVYYHPQSKRAVDIEQLVMDVGNECEKLEIPFFLEPLSYSLENGGNLTNNEKRNVVIETAKRLTKLGPDILKAEFPIDIRNTDDEQVWKEACTELSEASAIPWVLLSASVNFDTYLRQTRVACEAGCMVSPQAERYGRKQ